MALHNPKEDKKRESTDRKKSVVKALSNSKGLRSRHKARVKKIKDIMKKGSKDFKKVTR